MVDHGVIQAEFNACGLPELRYFRNGAFVFDRKLTSGEQALLDKIIAAHGKPRSNSARAELDAALTEAQQAEYRACRDKEVKDARRERYTNETDHMILDVLAGADPAKTAAALGVKQADIEAWQAARQQITDDLPY